MNYFYWFQPITVMTEKPGKLWQKDAVLHREVEMFTVGNDRRLDQVLAPFDVLGSLAHVKMLGSVGLLSRDETEQLTAALRQIHRQIGEGAFAIEPGVEDVHSQVEWMLTAELGDTGKKIHSGRSRNDQVLVDLKMWMRSELASLVGLTTDLFDVLLRRSEEHRGDLLPGYTHLQVAMPSSFGLWFAAYAESLTDDLLAVRAAYDLCNRNPLGSAAGYGSSFPLDRQMTTDLLGFESMNFNSAYAQMTRGKSERAYAAALASVADTLARLAMDICLYAGQDFGFLRLPEAYTTGSSIMPHKKNPDVFELIRAKCNRIRALPGTLGMITGNLPSGYHRDMQELKDLVIPAGAELKSCLRLATDAIGYLEVRRNILEDERYRDLFSVERVNQLVLEGVPFRDAYRRVAEEIRDGTFQPTGALRHSHAGSIGNLRNDGISQRMQELQRPFEAAETRIQACYRDLLGL
jgi:argininosuccinate lyase